MNVQPEKEGFNQTEDGDYDVSSDRVNDELLSTLDMLKQLPTPNDAADNILSNWPTLYGALSLNKANPDDVAALRANLLSVLMLIKRERDTKNREYMVNILLGNAVTLRRKIDKLELGLTSDATDEKGAA